MAVPGRIDCPASAGCLNLIREGARMVTSVDDVIEELTPIAPRDSVAQERDPPAGGRAVAPRPLALPEVKLSVEEALVLRQVPAAGATVDAVARAAQLPIAKTNALLVALRLKGRVRFLPGNRVASR